MSETRIVSPMPSCSRMLRPAVLAMMPLLPSPGLGEAQVERIVAAGRQQAVDLDQVLHSGDLGAEDDPVVRHAGGLGQGRGLRARSRPSPPCTTSRRPGRGAAGVGIHHLGQQALVERAPVDADPDRLVVRERDLDDGAEVLVVPLAADVAGIDAILGEGARAVGILVSSRWPL